jgi:mannose-6-phosphate isomerase-like protein (cupin superfamily)
MKSQKNGLTQVIKFSIHFHQRINHSGNNTDGITLYSCRLPELPVGFQVSPEIYQLHFKKDKKAKPIPTIRGGHAHIKKEEIFLVISGECKLLLKDEKVEKQILLKDPTSAVYVPAGIWHEIEFCENCILQVISSTKYSDEERAYDYIEDFHKYLGWKKS